MKLFKLHEVIYADKDVYIIPKKIGDILTSLLEWIPKYDTAIPHRTSKYDRWVVSGKTKFDKVVLHQISEVIKGNKPSALVQKIYIPILNKYGLAHVSMPNSEDNIITVTMDNLHLLEYFRFTYGFDMDVAARHYMLGIGLGYQEDEVLKFIEADERPVKW